MLADESATERLGEAVAAHLGRGEAVCLSGPLGAGKSTLARALIRAWVGRADEDVPSPTFTLVQTYEGGPFPIAHFDLYRLKRPEEAFELGLDEALDEGAALIEWPERLNGAQPADRLAIDFAITDAGARRVRLTGHGAWADHDRDL